MPVEGDRPWPLPSALAKDRTVRALLLDDVATGRVVDSRSDQVTLRVQQDHDVTFPTVRVVDCEPIDVAAPEAIEFGFAALQSKDALLARLWLACADARSGGSSGLRAQRLREILQ
jgi:hypothetical protein